MCSENLARFVTEADDALFKAPGKFERIEAAKKPKDEVAHTVETQQVSDYWAGYGLVLVTNYRDFTLLGTGDDGYRTLNSTAAFSSPRRRWPVGNPVSA